MTISQKAQSIIGLARHYEKGRLKELKESSIKHAAQHAMHEEWERLDKLSPGLEGNPYNLTWIDAELSSAERAAIDAQELLDFAVEVFVKMIDKEDSE